MMVEITRALMALLTLQLLKEQGNKGQQEILVFVFFKVWIYSIFNSNNTYKYFGWNGYSLNCPKITLSQE
jgi:hypothetical protein